MKKTILFTALCSLLTLTAQAQFIDVDVTHPYFHSIVDLYQDDVIKGYTVNDEQFYRPRQAINRAEVLKILMLSAGLDPVEEFDNTFPDVPASAWFTPYVSTAAGRGIVKGYPDGKFYPEVKVTRAEFLKMLIESFEIPKVETAATDWFAPYLDTATEFRLLPEEDLPHEHINRGEVAEIIFRANQTAVSGFESRYTYQASGKASYYNQGFAGRPTANGEIYDPYGFTAAHRTLPFNTKLKVFNEDGKFIVVRINDRGPYHKDRVLDLSERAFEELAPISRGVIPVKFEVLADPQDESLPIPEQIRPNLTLESRSPEIPTELHDRLRDEVGGEPEKTAPEEAEVPVLQPLFAETIASLSQDFFEGVELRRFVPQKIVAGQVLQISGRVVDGRRPETATVFLTHRSTREQQSFKTTLSGENFEIAVPFYESGLYQMGLVFDAQKRSRVGEIEVVSDTKIRRFAASNVRFASNLETETVPEDEVVLLRWSSARDRLSRLVFTQGGESKSLIFEYGQSFFAVPYEFFADFGPNSDLVISLEQAASADGAWASQTTNWKEITALSYRLLAGFPDEEQVGVLSIPNFQRFYRTLDPVSHRVEVLDASIRVGDNIYITDPRGGVTDLPLEFVGGRMFEFEFDPSVYGRYVLEIISDEGQILFNRAIYFSQTEILPVLEKAYTDVKLQNKSGILHWINTIRAESRRSTLASNPELAAAAQRYAERMANEDFLAHVAPDGETLGDRVKGIESQSFGENLAYGSNLELALNGLEDSASHYQNLISTTWTKVGIGVAQNQKGDIYVTQIFAK